MNENFKAWFELFSPKGTAKEIAEQAWTFATLSALQKTANALPKKYTTKEIDLAGAIEKVVMKYHNQLISNIENKILRI